MTVRGRGRPPETTHAEIREVARAMFARQGYAATSLAQIAAAVGISRTTLFSYFPAKRDLITEEYGEGMARARATLAEASADTHVVDLIVAVMLATARYGADEHAEFAERMRIVERDDELRAFAALGVQDLTRRVADTALRYAPDADRETIDLVTRALIAVGARCTEQWAAADSPAEGLDAYTAARLRPIAEALRPLLP